MKPEFTRPFNVEHAKAGAVYCCRDGDEATVLKWDARDAEFPILGISGVIDAANSWTLKGRYFSHFEEDHEADLVMLPLGMCEGKPVFTGDILKTSFGNIWIAQSASRYFSEFSWPVPAKIYPVSLMSDRDITTCWFSGGNTGSHRRIADAAIRHAIDAGQVVIAEVQP